MSLISKKSFKKAVSCIAKYGDTDIFPFPFDNYIMQDTPDNVIACLEKAEQEICNCSRIEEYIGKNPIYKFSTLAPVTQTGFRWATQLDSFWNAYLLAAVIEIAPDIEKSRLPEFSNHVFSYRYSTAPTEMYKTDGWSNFQVESQKQARKHKYVIITDISDFYSRIYHHRLENSLYSSVSDKKRNIIPQIMAILMSISDNKSYGLPVGGAASRLLAESVLDNTDHLIQMNTSIPTFCRYVDDYRIFVDSESEAYKAIQFLSEKLQVNEGLTLQKSKTRIVSSEEYIKMTKPSETNPGSTADFMSIHIHYDPYSSSPDLDYENARKALENFNIVDLLNQELDKSQPQKTVTKRLISVLTLLNKDTKFQMIQSLLDSKNLDALIPIFPFVLSVIYRQMSSLDPEMKSTICAIIRSMIENNHQLAQLELNKAYMVRILGSYQSYENEQIILNLYDSASIIVKRDIYIIMFNWNRTYWLSDKKNYIGQEHAWIRRAFYVSSYCLGDEGKHWRNYVKTQVDEYTEVIKQWISSKINTRNTLEIKL